MKIKNGFRTETNGWIYVSVKGTPYERGYAHGYLVAKEIKEIMKMLDYLCYESLGYKRVFFSEIVGTLYGEIIEKNFPEYYQEIEGITQGVNAGGTSVTLHDMIFWNCYTSFDSMYGSLPELINAHPVLSKKYGGVLKEGASSGHAEGGGRHGSKNIFKLKKGTPDMGDHCTGFIAVGSYTKDGKIVLGHNTFDNFISGQTFNVVLDVKPSKGHRIVMQAAPGYISSQTDYYVADSGIACTETTIGGFKEFELKDPICCRIRRAMQYGNNLDDMVKILTLNNGGDYANSWLFGDTKTNTIMRIELGKEYVNVEKTKDGYFIGFNAAYDPRIRNLECANSGWDDMRRHQGSRRVRLEQLMEEHKGKIDIKVAQEIMGDHYDVYLNKINPCSRTNCSHYELDAREFMSDPSRPKPFQPRGAVDGIVGDSTLTKKMGFCGRWGSSCGLPFIVKDFVAKSPIWSNQAPYLHDRPTQPWTDFFMHPWIKNLTRHKERKIARMRHTKRGHKLNVAPTTTSTSAE